MKRAWFSGEQTIWGLNEAEAGPKTGDLVRRCGVSEAKIYNCKSKGTVKANAPAGSEGV